MIVIIIIITLSPKLIELTTRRATLLVLSNLPDNSMDARCIS